MVKLEQIKAAISSQETKQQLMDPQSRLFRLNEKLEAYNFKVDQQNQDIDRLNEF